MENRDSFNKQYHLSEIRYKKIKQINITSFEILNDFVNGVYEMFKNIDEYFVNSYKVIAKLEEISFVGKYYFQAIDYLLDVPDNQMLINKEENREMLRYYYADAWNYFIRIVSDKKIIIKQLSKKMLKEFTYTGEDEMKKHRNITYKKFKNLQAELDNILQDSETE